jgi:hypothetical protein
MDRWCVYAKEGSRTKPFIRTTHWLSAGNGKKKEEVVYTL